MEMETEVYKRDAPETEDVRFPSLGVCSKQDPRLHVLRPVLGISLVVAAVLVAVPVPP